jgi:hypothetical protein
MTCGEFLEHASAALLAAEEIIETSAVSGAFHLVNRYTNTLDRCFTWRYSGAQTMEDNALWP